MKKNIFLIVAMIIVTISASAQQKVNYSVHTGYNCILIQGGAVSTFDKDPLDGSSKIGYGANLKAIYFRKGISYMAEGRYATGRSALLAGIGVNLLNNKRITPSLEVMAGMGEQLLGFGYQADISGDANGHLKQMSYDKKFRVQAEAGLNLEVNLAETWSLVVSGGIIYRPYEGSKSNVNSNIDINGSDVTESSNALEFQTKKFIPKVSIGIRFRIK